MQLTSKVKAALAATAAGGVLASGAVIPATAQDPAPTEQATEDAAPSPDRPRHQRLERFAAALAEELGIERDRVEQALRTVREELRQQARQRRLDVLEERLDRAVEDGDLTREQADAILEAAEEGVLPLGRLAHRDHRRWHRGRAGGLHGPGPR